MVYTLLKIVDAQIAVLPNDVPVSTNVVEFEALLNALTISFGTPRRTFPIMLKLFQQNAFFEIKTKSLSTFYALFDSQFGMNTNIGNICHKAYG